MIDLNIKETYQGERVDIAARNFLLSEIAEGRKLLTEKQLALADKIWSQMEEVAKKSGKKMEEKAIRQFLALIQRTLVKDQHAK